MKRRNAPPATTARRRTKVTRPGLVLIVIAFVATLAGHFTLTRIGLEIPVLNDTRVLLFAAMLMAFALETKAAGHRPSTGAAARALHPVLLLLGYQLLSAAWGPRGALKTDLITHHKHQTIQQ
jgi:hypothetical protein